MAARNGNARTLRTAGLALGLVGGVLGFVVAFGVWAVGYCGAFTPDTTEPGTLRHDLCHGTGGDLMAVLVVAAWLWAGIAPGVGAYLGLRRDSLTPLVWFTVLGVIPIAAIAVLGEVLPQS
jgi:hypothetical protein